MSVPLPPPELVELLELLDDELLLLAPPPPHPCIINAAMLIDMSIFEAVCFKVILFNLFL